MSITAEPMPGYRLQACACGLFAFAIGGLAIIGWNLDNPILKGIDPAFPVMKFNAAVCAVLAGLGLVLCLNLRPVPRRIGQACGLLTAVIGILTLSEFVFGWNLGIDQIFVRAAAENPGQPPGRMAIPAAFCFSLLGVSLLRLERPLAHGLAITAMATTLPILVGYVLGARFFEGLLSSAYLALNAAIAVILLSVGVLSAYPNQGFMAVVVDSGPLGRHLRTLVPLVVLFWIAFALLRLHAESVGLFGLEFGTALMTSVAMITTLGLLWLITRDGIAALREKAQLEERLRERADLLDVTHDSISTRDAAGRIKYWNRGAQVRYGWSGAEALGRVSHELLRTVFPVPREEIEAELARTGHWEGHLVQTCKDGSKVIEASRWIARRDAAGRIVAVLETSNDITGLERDRLDRERAERERLETLVATSRMKDEFLSVVSHELRTPLNFISGFARVLDDEVVGELNDRQHDCLRKIKEGSDRMLGLVRDLLDGAQIVAGKFQVRPACTRYEPVLEEALSSLEPLANEKGISLQCDVQVPNSVLMDGARIKQVVSNLVDNAIKFTNPGGRIDLRAWLQDQELVTEVVDTGDGIPAEDLAKLFTRFGQLDMSSTRKARGTGLGLSICKSIVEAHGGRIGVISQPGQGSTFWFTLPLAAGCEDPQSARPATERTSGSSPRKK